MIYEWDMENFHKVISNNNRELITLLADYEYFSNKEHDYTKEIHAAEDKLNHSWLSRISGSYRKKLHDELQILKQNAQKNHDAFTQHERERAIELKNKRDSIQAILNGEDIEGMFKMLDKGFKRISFPLFLDAEFHIERGDFLVMSINTPEKRLFPYDYQKRVDRYHNELYVQFLCGVAIRFTNECYAILPSLNRIYAHVYTNIIDNATGKPKRTCLVSAVIDRYRIEGIELENVVPLEFIRSINSRTNIDRNFSMGAVVPIHHNKEQTGDVDDKMIDLDSIDPIAFEYLVLELCERMGMESMLTKASHDGGVDVIAFDPTPIKGGKYVIQCKRYMNTISVDIVRDLYGTMTHEQANKGILITTSDYSPDCQTFAENKPIELINRSQLIKLLKDNGFSLITHT